MSEQDDLGLLKRTLPDVANTVHIPLLSEACLTLTAVIVVLSAGGAAIASLMARAPMLVVLMRTGVTILVVGLLGFLINWLIAKYLVVSTVEKLEEEMTARASESEDIETQA